MGGGNSLNIIRVPSINKFLYILYNDTLNDSIVAGNENTWHKVWAYYNWSQVNRQNTACLYGVSSNGVIYYESYYNKSELTSSHQDDFVFRPIIEFKE